MFMGTHPFMNKKRKTPEQEEERRAEWKTSLCSFFRRPSRYCRHGARCRYAHGEAELRPRPDNSWDPTSERAKELLRSEAPPPEPREDGADHLDSSLDKCIVNLPLKMSAEKLQRFLYDEGIVYKTARKKRGTKYGFVSFESAEHVKNAIEALDGKPINAKYLKVANCIRREKKPEVSVNSEQSSTQTTECLDSEDPATSSSSGATENEDNVNKDSNIVVDSDSKTRSARVVVTPLAHMSYSEQLEHKKSSLVQILKRLTRNVRKACPNAVLLPEWIVKSTEIGGFPCKLESILESPLINGYLNKCIFSVGYSQQGKRTVGFMLGNFREGMTTIEEPFDCPNVSRIACKYAMIFQEFLQSSALPVWNRIDNTGFWRKFTVREGRNPYRDTEVENVEASVAEVMLIVQICSMGADDELVTSEFQRMAHALAYGASASSPPLPLTALVVQDHKGLLIPLSIAKEESTFGQKDPTAAEARIHDYIGGLRFCISPTTSFQVNTLAAEKLYSLAGDWAGLGPETLLFDICCGTGTIGLTLANRVGMVVGIEMNHSAVLDAQRNAEVNGVKNCRFVCSKAEDVMGSLLREYLNTPQQPVPIHHFKDAVAIVDPPGVGLHPTVIRALRTHPRLRRLVYISCNPESLVANAIELCTPSCDKPDKGNKDRVFKSMGCNGFARRRAKSMPNSEPFRPVRAVAVDLFPHTSHCEMMMLLER